MCTRSHSCIGEQHSHPATAGAIRSARGRWSQRISTARALAGPWYGSCCCETSMSHSHELRSGPVSRGALGGHLSAEIREARMTLASEHMRKVAFYCRYRSSGLATEIGVSERHLRRLFSDCLGCSPHAWMREERLQLARRMLATPRSVKEVAYELAYKQPSQFCRDSSDDSVTARLPNVRSARRSALASPA